ncbi:MAG: helix-turn-helix transcriptional regulator [Oscillospiraceae bacterium]|nr:helix-turn-helix transcriptional regulator [Oscillospiraceae bacterium]
MDDILSIGSLIKRHIKMRGRTVKEVAVLLGRNYTTLSGVLKRDAVDAKLLFQLANLLDIDLLWMVQLFDQRRPISSMAPYQVPRMQSDFRNHDCPEVRRQLDDCIRNNPTSIADARRELIRRYSNVFYLLDVLMPEEDIIRITVERGKEKYFCIPVSSPSCTRGRPSHQIYDSTEMLNLIIATRKEEIL